MYTNGFHPESQMEIYKIENSLIPPTKCAELWGISKNLNFGGNKITFVKEVIVKPGENVIFFELSPSLIIYTVITGKHVVKLVLIMTVSIMLL